MSPAIVAVYRYGGMSLAASGLATIVVFAGASAVFLTGAFLAGAAFFAGAGLPAGALLMDATSCLESGVGLSVRRVRAQKSPSRRRGRRAVAVAARQHGPLRSRTAPVMCEVYRPPHPPRPRVSLMITDRSGR